MPLKLLEKVRKGFVMETFALKKFDSFRELQGDGLKGSGAASVGRKGGGKP